MRRQKPSRTVHQLLPIGHGSPAIPTGTMLAVPLGGGKDKRGGSYVQVLERERLESVEVLNERWRVGKGARRAERADILDNNEE